MEKMIPKTFRQFLALLLCVAMLVPMIPSPVFATEVTEPVVAGTEAVPETTEPAGTDATEAAPDATIPAMKEIVVPGSEEDEAGENELSLLAHSVPDFTILAGSDFQALGGSEEIANDRAASGMSAILDKVLINHGIDALLFCGDYSSVTPSESNQNFPNYAEYCKNGYNRLMEVLESRGLGGDDVQKIFVQGNHDHVEPIEGLPFISPTKGFDLEHYGVYVLNFKDYNSGSQYELTITHTADNLEDWLDRRRYHNLRQGRPDLHGR